MSWFTETVNSKERKKLRFRTMSNFKVGTEEPICIMEHKNRHEFIGDGFVIVVMTYKRSLRLKKLLDYVARSLESRGLASKSNIIVAQSTDLKDPKSVSCAPEADAPQA